MGTCTAGRNDPSLPITCVEHDQAEAYCAWVGKRLPTEAEWEAAARGATGSVFPWGDAAPSCAVAIFGTLCGDIMPTGSLPDGSSPYGALDMGGNAAEFVADAYDPSYYDEVPGQAPIGPPPTGQFSVRGGSEVSAGATLRASDRQGFDALSTGGSIGFRCARAL